MQTRRHSVPLKPVRRGFTLIELLVVISIIAVLMALILPAIQSAKEAARRTTCLNNMRNVALAAIDYAEKKGGRLPASGTYPGADTDSDGLRDTIYAGHSWIVDILPGLDQQAVYERWNKAASFAAGANVNVGQINIPVLTCPNDNTADGEAGGLSYVANVGIGDANVDVTSTSPTGTDAGHCAAVEGYVWDGSTAGSRGNVDLTGDLNVFAPSIEIDFNATATGAVLISASPKSANIGKIYDGATNTILLAENVMGGANALTGAKTWADPSVRSAGFLFPVDPAAGVTFKSLVAGRDATGGNPYINKNSNGTDGSAPYPNSRHIGLCVFSFCDGSAKTLADDIDTGVYVRLITPSGARPRPNLAGAGYVPEDPISGTDF